MLTDNELKTIQKLIMREVTLLAAKIEDSQQGTDSEAKTAARLLRYYAGIRSEEIEKGENFIHFNQPAD